jgi:ABC-type bacteriocin/lantibiotic exporter with double-glycine peptidase domain
MRLVTQRANGDCGIAALATLLDLSWDDVYVAAATIDKSCRGKSGLIIKDMIGIAGVLGVKLQRKRGPARFDEDEGVLYVNWTRKQPKGGFTAHYVVLGNGVIVDPADGVISDPEEYLDLHQGKAGTLLEVK